MSKTTDSCTKHVPQGKRPSGKDRCCLLDIEINNVSIVPSEDRTNLIATQAPPVQRVCAPPITQNIVASRPDIWRSALRQHFLPRTALIVSPCPPLLQSDTVREYRPAKRFIPASAPDATARLQHITHVLKVMARKTASERAVLRVLQSKQDARQPSVVQQLEHRDAIVPTRAAR